MSAATLRSAARTDVGRARDRNEDSYFAGTRVFAVADGLGGHNAGDVASKLAIEPIKALDRRIDGAPPERVSDLLSDTMLEANRAVFKRAQDDAKVRGMGTTLTVIVVTDSMAHIAHVGDSRCYLLRGGAINQLSSDHTLVARMVQEGKLTAEQAEVHPQRSILTRALGAEPEVEVDSLEVELQPADRILLCSDGLSSVIGEERIRALLSEAKDLEGACASLIEEANAKGGPDNITVVIVEVTGTAPPRSGPAVARVADRVEARAKAAAGPHGPSRVPVRAIIWTLAVILIALGGWIGVRSWVNRSYYVGLAGDRVAIFRGLPTEVAGVNLHHVQETTGIRIEQVASYFQQNLRDGIRAKSLAAARRVVTSIPLAGAKPAATPTPKPTATKT